MRPDMIDIAKRSWIVVLAWLCLPAVHAASVQAPKGVLALETRPAPALALSDMDGQGYDLADARGRWVFVHFWASWCGPCRKEMPAIARLEQAVQAHALALDIVLINTAEDEDTVFGFMAEVAPQMSSLMDRDGQSTEHWRPRGLPATYLVDPQGVIRYQALGGRPWDETPYINFLKQLTNQP